MYTLFCGRVSTSLLCSFIRTTTSTAYFVGSMSAYLISGLILFMLFCDHCAQKPDASVRGSSGIWWVVACTQLWATCVFTRRSLNTMRLPVLDWTVLSPKSCWSWYRCWVSSTFVLWCLYAVAAVAEAVAGHLAINGVVVDKIRLASRTKTLPCSGKHARKRCVHHVHVFGCVDGLCGWIGEPILCHACCSVLRVHCSHACGRTVAQK